METTSFSRPFPVTHCSLIADIVFGSFSQIGHELTYGGGEQWIVIDCPRNSNRPETVTGTDTLNTEKDLRD